MTKITAIISTVLAVVLLAPLMLVAMISTTAASANAAVETQTPCAGQVTAPTSTTWRVPFTGVGYQRTSPFGMRLHPVLKVWKLHDGVDLVAPQTSVVAVADGTITTAGPAQGWGNHVVIDHGGGITSLYAHLATIDPALKPGRRVVVGQRLGVEGSTGYSTGIHLHFSIRRNGTPIDPVPFMAAHGAPLDGRPVAATSRGATPRDQSAGEGGMATSALPKPRVRKDSLHNPPLPIPPRLESIYRQAATRYGLPWTLLAGIGMEETAHGRNNSTSSAGAQGLMQFMPATFSTMGVDGNHDGRVLITDDADSIHSAAHYLVTSGVLRGQAGVEKALYAYNHADWYVGDVLHYAHAYGGGQIITPVDDCDPGIGSAPTGDPVAAGDTAKVLAWAKTKLGGRYIMGAAGPDAYDCSSYTQAAYHQIGLRLPRTAQAQRDWLAAGHGIRIRPGQEKPGDLIFIDSYLGPRSTGHVALVWDPKTQQTIEAASSNRGIIIGDYRDWSSRNIYEIWRPGQDSAGSLAVSSGSGSLALHGA